MARTKLFCGQIDALAFLLTEDIPDGIMYICNNTAPGTEYLVDCFDLTYVTGTVRRADVPRDGLDGAVIVRMRWVPPRYPHILWNVQQATER